MQDTVDLLQWNAGRCDAGEDVESRGCRSKYLEGAYGARVANPCPVRRLLRGASERRFCSFPDL